MAENFRELTVGETETEYLYLFRPGLNKEELAALAKKRLPNLQEGHGSTIGWLASFLVTQATEYTLVAFPHDYLAECNTTPEECAVLLRDRIAASITYAYGGLNADTLPKYTGEPELHYGTQNL